MEPSIVAVGPLLINPWVIYASWAQMIKNAHHQAMNNVFWHIYWRYDGNKTFVQDLCKGARDFKVSPDAVKGRRWQMVTRMTLSVTNLDLCVAS